MRTYVHKWRKVLWATSKYMFQFFGPHILFKLLFWLLFLFTFLAWCVGWAMEDGHFSSFYSTFPTIRGLTLQIRESMPTAKQVHSNSPDFCQFTLDHFFKKLFNWFQYAAKVDLQQDGQLPGTYALNSPVLSPRETSPISATEPRHGLSILLCSAHQAARHQQRIRIANGTRFGSCVWKIYSLSKTEPTKPSLVWRSVLPPSP